MRFIEIIFEIFGRRISLVPLAPPSKRELVLVLTRNCKQNICRCFHNIKETHNGLKEMTSDQTLLSWPSCNLNYIIITVELTSPFIFIRTTAIITVCCNSGIITN